MTSNSNEQSQSENPRDEQLIQIARETVDALEAMTDRLERFIQAAEEARK